MDTEIFVAWDELLLPTTSWLTSVAATERALDNFVRSAPLDVDARIIRGARCPEEQSLFQEYGAALQFPYYFGHNWDAFNECMHDLEWIRAQKMVVLISKIDHVLPHDAEHFAILGRTLMEAARPAVTEASWREEEGPDLLRFVVQSEQSNRLNRLSEWADGIPARRLDPDLE